jgi:hypothetical protein
MKHGRQRHQPEVVVVGGTPGGLAAAITAARMGCHVVLVEYHHHLGGMAASGLGKSDIEHRHLIGGLFQEFVQRIRRSYLARYRPGSADFKLCRNGYYYAPSVAEQEFDAMVDAQPRLSLRRGYRLESVSVAAGRLVGAVVRDRISGQPETLEAQVFVDATYEGDLLAMAGAPYRLGRESRQEFGEPHAGIVYFDYENNALLPGSTGHADSRLPAYTYRLCLTTDPDNSFVLQHPPPDYDRSLYLPYLDDLAAGRLSAPRSFRDGWGYYPEHFDTLMRALSVTDLPGRKVDANINPRPLAFPFAEENLEYVTGDWARREAICLRHRHLTLGLLYFLQNDRAVPVEHRELANRYHLPLDEFVDNGHFPFQLYVREARRLRGRITMTEHDVAITDRGCSGRFDDAIAVGEFPIDSFPVGKRQPSDDRVLEGYLGMLDGLTRPYQIPYRAMLPESPEGLIVPVAASATHVAFSSIRMEPTWMAMGQAAGAAAYLAVDGGTGLADISIANLQDALRSQGQVLDPREARPAAVG